MSYESERTPYNKKSVMAQTNIHAKRITESVSQYYETESVFRFKKNCKFFYETEYRIRFIIL